MLDVICNGKSGAWQLLQKYFARRGLKDFIRTVEVTYNYKKSSWHPHIHGLFFVPKEYFSKDNKNYISQEQLAEYWQHACKLDYKPVVDIRRVYDKNKPKERIKLDTDIKAMDLSGAIFETAKYCVKPLNLFSNTLDNYDDNMDAVDELKVTINIKEIVRELSNALHGRRLRALGGKLRIIAKQLKFDDDENKKDLIHNDENATAEAVWQEIYEYVFEDKEYYLTAREEIAQENNIDSAVSNIDINNQSERNFATDTADGSGQLTRNAMNKLDNFHVYSENAQADILADENYQIVGVEELRLSG
jgi:plasmid rolling circle replication initiator protein Rep